MAAGTTACTSAPPLACTARSIQMCVLCNTMHATVQHHASSCRGGGPHLGHVPAFLRHPEAGGPALCPEHGASQGHDSFGARDGHVAFVVKEGAALEHLQGAGNLRGGTCGRHKSGQGHDGFGARDRHVAFVVKEGAALKYLQGGGGNKGAESVGGTRGQGHD